jgi:hypothetical protein
MVVRLELSDKLRPELSDPMNAYAWRLACSTPPYCLRGTEMGSKRSACSAMVGLQGWSASRQMPPRFVGHRSLAARAQKRKKGRASAPNIVKV